MIFGSLATGCAIVMVFLPESANLPLPDFLHKQKDEEQLRQDPLTKHSNEKEMIEIPEHSNLLGDNQ